MAPAYVDWVWEPGQQLFRELVTDITIHNDVGDFSNRLGYYLILCQNNISGAGFYFGLQTDANGHGKALIYSRWGTRDLANARWDETDGWSESSGHEGDFIGVRRSYDWGAGDYRIRLAPDGLDNDGEWFGLWITNLASGELTWVGALKFPLDERGLAAFEARTSATTELYGVGRVRPIDIPVWHISVKPPLGDGVRALWAFTHYPWDDSANALFNSDVWYDAATGAAHIIVGGATVREHEPSVIDVAPLPPPDPDAGAG